MSKPIIVIVSGGNVQDVLNVPPGVVIEVHDYDTTCTDIDGDLRRDPDGAAYTCATYKGEG